MVLDNYKSDISQEMSPQFIRVIITDQLKLVRARIFVQLTAWCRDGKSLDVENMLIWLLSHRWGLGNPMVHVSNVIWYPIKKPNPWDTRNEHPGVLVFINILTWDKINKWCPDRFDELYCGDWKAHICQFLSYLGWLQYLLYAARFNSSSFDCLFTTLTIHEWFAPCVGFIIPTQT
jgi:hypothetical protein